MLHSLIVNNASPTLAGLKTANLFRYTNLSKDELVKEIRSINKVLKDKGLRLISISNDKNISLLYLYRPKMLELDISNNISQRILKDLGYECTEVNQCLVKVIEKIKTSKEFPHEIGLFLGYPPLDVQLFIENKSKNFKCCGCWKVYTEEEKAKECFLRFKRCKECYLKQFLSGITIEKLAIAI